MSAHLVTSLDKKSYLLKTLYAQHKVKIKLLTGRSLKLNSLYLEKY